MFNYNTDNTQQPCLYISCKPRDAFKRILELIINTRPGYSWSDLVENSSKLAPRCKQRSFTKNRKNLKTHCQFYLFYTWMWPLELIEKVTEVSLYEMGFFESYWTFVELLNSCESKNFQSMALDTDLSRFTFSPPSCKGLSLSLYMSIFWKPHSSSLLLQSVNESERRSTSLRILAADKFLNLLPCF